MGEGIGGVTGEGTGGGWVRGQVDGRQVGDTWEG